MHYILRLVIMLVGMWMFTGCCWTDHSETIKKVVEPMAKELEHFYKVHKRFPTDKERDMMLERVGCRMKGNTCKYNLNHIQIKNSIAVNYYGVTMSIENTYCSIYLNSNETIDKINCLQNPCIELGQ